MQRRRILVKECTIDSVGFGLGLDEIVGSLCRECIKAGGSPFRNRPDSQSGVR